MIIALLLTLNVAIAEHSQIITQGYKPEFLQPCQCVGGIKDYDPAKGFYFDKIEQVGFRKKISGRFACSYTCRDSKGEFWSVSYIHEEWHWLKGKTGAELAQWFICDQSISKFTPKYDYTGKLLYYQTEPYGPFDARSTKRIEFGNWTNQVCK